MSVGVSVQLNALVAGNGFYILWPCGHDLHGPTHVILLLLFILDYLMIYIFCSGSSICKTFRNFRKYVLKKKTKMQMKQNCARFSPELFC